MVYQLARELLIHSTVMESMTTRRLNWVSGQKCSTKPFKIGAFVAFRGSGGAIGFQQCVFGGHRDGSPVAATLVFYR